MIAYVDFGSSCLTIQSSAVNKFNLSSNSVNQVLSGFGNSRVISLGIVQASIAIDEVSAEISLYIVDNDGQDTPLLISRNFTELLHVLVVKDTLTLQLAKNNNFEDAAYLAPVEPPLEQPKLVLRVSDTVIIPPAHLRNVPLSFTGDYVGDALVEVSIRPQEGHEHCVPRTILTLSAQSDGEKMFLPVINLSHQELHIKQNRVFARASPCVEETLAENTKPESVRRIDRKNCEK